ncbi:MFS transporter [Brevirhabdus pacifica]|uniref:MFS transporter n=1 Tax=Brevirhabdus pacifica TaxID=1267768 RepID=A0A1U7DHR9_9RHOB|nr:c-type cytochrome [Brevirhabdus pacifica]APX89418.1 MFS transporter [Brevirhabdus pacifica]OWU76560.1 MFS transporter [Loktanella sp. 22II-4b]PJJ85939.1 sulfur dehydrogenase subunit SoxD [Brevirhabdus pacifica]
MSKSVSIAAVLGATAVLGLAYTTADFNVTPLPAQKRVDVVASVKAEEPAETAQVARAETAATPAPVKPAFTANLSGAAHAAEGAADAAVLPAGYSGDTGNFGLGRPATEEEIAAWDIDVRPDGAGLPEGSGSVMDGEPLYTDNCAVCHGDFGEAVGRWPVLAGGKGSLKNDRPVKTIGSYWPYLSTVFDYVNRAMPFGNAQSLTNDEVYAITAYLLYLNDLVDDEFTLSKETFLDVKMPNAEAFYPDDRAEVELPKFSGEVCMTDCKPEVEITARAAIVDVTPEDTATRKAREAEATGEDSGVTEADAAAPAEEASEEAPAEEATEEAAATEEKAEAPAAAEAPVVASETAADPELIADGEKVFKKCKACHQVGDGAKNKSGPMLNGIVGATAGTVDGFRYSSAMEEAGAGGLVWTKENLHGFLTKPKDFLDGTKMGFSGLRKEDDREAVIAYIGSFTK